jgi:hypothetical protein
MGDLIRELPNRSAGAVRGRAARAARRPRPAARRAGAPAPPRRAAAAGAAMRRAGAPAAAGARAREIATEARAWAENVVLLHGVYMYTIVCSLSRKHNVLEPRISDGGAIQWRCCAGEPN